MMSRSDCPSAAELGRGHAERDPMLIAHARACERCRAEWRGSDALAELITRTEPQALPSDRADRVRAALLSRVARPRSARRRAWPILAAASVLLFASAAGAAWWTGRMPEWTGVAPRGAEVLADAVRVGRADERTGSTGARFETAAQPAAEQRVGAVPEPSESREVDAADRSPTPSPGGAAAKMNAQDRSSGGGASSAVAVKGQARAEDREESRAVAVKGQARAEDREESRAVAVKGQARAEDREESRAAAAAKGRAIVDDDRGDVPSAIVRSESDERSMARRDLASRSAARDSARPAITVANEVDEAKAPPPETATSSEGRSAAPAVAGVDAPAETARGNSEYERAWAQLRDGAPREAAAGFALAAERATRADDRAEARFWRAVALARAGDAADARRVLEALLADEGAFARRAEASVMLGWMLFDAGEDRAAKERFEEGLDSASEEARRGANAGLEALRQRAPKPAPDDR